MFTLPQSSAAVAEDMEDGVPVVRLEETWIVLDIVLRHCLPRSVRSQSESLPLTMRVLDAAKKYEMDWMPAYAQAAFDLLLAKQPVHAYFLAFLYCHRDEQQLAAQACLRQPMSVAVNTCLEEFEGLVPLSALQALIQYRLACRGVVVDLLKSWDPLQSWEIYAIAADDKCAQFWHNQYNRCCYKTSLLNIKDPAGKSHSVQQWWANFMTYTREKAEDMSCEDVVEEAPALQLFMTEGPQCSHCRSSAYDSISSFTKCLSTMIQKELLKVSG